MADTPFSSFFDNNFQYMCFANGTIPSWCVKMNLQAASVLEENVILSSDSTWGAIQWEKTVCLHSFNIFSHAAGIFGFSLLSLHTSLSPNEEDVCELVLENVYDGPLYLLCFLWLGIRFLDPVTLKPNIFMSCVTECYDHLTVMWRCKHFVSGWLYLNYQDPVVWNISLKLTF